MKVFLDAKDWIDDQYRCAAYRQHIVPIIESYRADYEATSGTRLSLRKALANWSVEHGLDHDHVANQIDRGRKFCASMRSEDLERAYQESIQALIFTEATAASCIRVILGLDPMPDDEAARCAIAFYRTHAISPPPPSPSPSSLSQDVVYYS